MAVVKVNLYISLTLLHSQPVSVDRDTALIGFANLDSHSFLSTSRWRQPAACSRPRSARICLEAHVKRLSFGAAWAYQRA